MGRVLELLGSSWDARNVVLLKGFDGFRKNHFSQKNQILERKSEILGPQKETKSDKKRIKKSIIFRMRFFSEIDPKKWKIMSGESGRSGGGGRAAACAEPVGDYRGSDVILDPSFITPDIVNDAADLRRFAHAAAPLRAKLPSV